MVVYEKLEFNGRQCAQLFLSDLQITILRGQRDTVYVVSLDSYKEFFQRYNTYLRKREHPQYHLEFLQDDRRMKKLLYIECFRASMCELEVQHYRHAIATPIIPSTESAEELCQSPEGNSEETITKVYNLYRLLIPQSHFDISYLYNMSEENLRVFRICMELYKKIVDMKGD